MTDDWLDSLPADEPITFIDKRHKPVYCGMGTELAFIRKAFTGRDLRGVRSVYLALCELLDGRDERRPSLTLITDYSGFTDQRATRRYLESLERLGLVHRQPNHTESGMQIANSYVLLTPSFAPSQVTEIGSSAPPAVNAESPESGSSVPPALNAPPSRAHPRDSAVAVDVTPWQRAVRDESHAVEKEISSNEEGGENVSPPSRPPDSPQTSESDFQLQSPPGPEEEQTPLFEARSIEDEQVARVWDHFVETNHPVRKEMSPAQERMIRRVLKELTVEEAELAIDGNRQSSWHRERGRHSLSDVFKPNATKRETIRQKADRFINDAVRAGKGQRVLSVDRGKVERHQKVVLRAHQPGASEVIMERLGPSIAWLEENGIEVRIVDGWPHFIEKDG